MLTGVLSSSAFPSFLSFLAFKKKWKKIILMNERISTLKVLQKKYFEKQF
jgi:hypothetical protein